MFFHLNVIQVSFCTHVSPEIITHKFRSLTFWLPTFKMVDAIVSAVLEQLISTSVEEAKEQVRLVTGVGKEVKRLQGNLEAIQAVLADAERKQVKEERVRLWLDKLKHASYDIEDVLDEWNTARLKLQIEGVDADNSLVPQQKVCSSFFPAASCFGFKQLFLRRDIAKKIKEMNETLDDIASQKDTFNLSVTRSNEEKSERTQSTALINVSDVCGRNEEKNALKGQGRIQDLILRWIKF